MNTNRNFFRTVSFSTCLAAFARVCCNLAQAATTTRPPSRQIGQAMLSLAAIPDDVTCIRVTAAGEFRSSVIDFDVVPGDTLTQALDRASGGRRGLFGQRLFSDLRQRHQVDQSPCGSATRRRSTSC
jgi:hypothetical protein